MAFSDLVRSIDRAAQAVLGGVTASYQPGVGNAVEVDGIFDQSYVLLDGEGAGVSEVGPAFCARLEDLPTDPRNDSPTVSIDGTVYRVREAMADGPEGGAVVMLLHEDSF